MHAVRPTDMCWVRTGQAVKVAMLLGDATTGGQILMSAEAMQASDVQLTRTGVVLKHLGVYDFHAKPMPVSCHPRRHTASFQLKGANTPPAGGVRK